VWPSDLGAPCTHTHWHACTHMHTLVHAYVHTNLHIDTHTRAPLGPASSITLPHPFVWSTGTGDNVGAWEAGS